MRRVAKQVVAHDVESECQDCAEAQRPSVRSESFFKRDSQLLHDDRVLARARGKLDLFVGEESGYSWTPNVAVLERLLGEDVRRIVQLKLDCVVDTGLPEGAEEDAACNPGRCVSERRCNPTDQSPPLLPEPRHFPMRYFVFQTVDEKANAWVSLSCVACSAASSAAAGSSAATSFKGAAESSTDGLWIDLSSTFKHTVALEGRDRLTRRPRHLRQS